MKFDYANDKQLAKVASTTAGGEIQMKQELSAENRGHKRCSSFIVMAAILMAMAPSLACAADPANFDRRYYVSGMYSRAFADNDRLTKDGNGGIFTVGKQIREKVSFELNVFGATYNANSGGGSSDFISFGGAISYFPFIESKAGKGLYALVGAGYGDGNSDVKTTPNTNESRYLFDVGIGYLLPVFGDIKLRLDARYRYDRLIDPYGDFDGESSNDTAGFEEPVLSIGVLVPIGRRPKPPAAVPVAVVEPIRVCADGVDNDGDGQIDFPADPGCSSAEDFDEIDPAQCSDGKDNDADGQIDFPADKGCTSADDTDEVNPCKTPESGGKVSLSGCGTGDVIVLRGVNFEFDKSRLTPNAKTILDGVTTELVAHPDIKIELGGHTDAKGADEYNQRLSEERAASVVQYLAEKGVATERLTSAGYGESQPVADNETEAGRELNRRVELKILEVSRAPPAVEASASVPPPTVPAKVAPASPEPSATPDTGVAPSTP